MSPSKRILISGGILAVAALAVFLFGKSPQPGDAALEGDGKTTHAGPDAMKADASDGASPEGDADEAAGTPGLMGRAEKAQAEQAEKKAGARVLEVHVIDRNKQPLPGVAVVIQSGRGARTKELARARTDRQGVARFPGHHPDKVRMARALQDGVLPDDVDDDAQWAWPKPVQDWVTTIQCRVGMPFRVVCFDVETGKELRDVKVGTGWILEDGKRVIVGRTIAGAPGGSLQGGFHIDVPEGYVAYEWAGAKLPIARWARSLLIHYPLHREADIEVALRRKDGKAIRGKVEAAFQFDHTGTLPLRMEWIEAGRHRVRDMPFVAGLSFDMHIASGDLGVDWSARLPFERDRPLRASLTLSEDDVGLLDDAPFEGPNTNGIIGIGGGPRPVEPPEPERGNLTVLCRRADGAPAPHVRVSAVGPWWSVQRNDGQTVRDRYRLSGRTNAAGRVTFDGAAVGEWQLSFRDWHRATGKAVVRRGESTELIMREPMGGSLVVTVVNGRDEPIPFARVGLLAGGDRNSFRPVPDEDGVQRVDAFTDVEGKRTLHRIAAGMHEITVRYHDQSLVMHVRIEEGKTTYRTIRIRR